MFKEMHVMTDTSAEPRTNATAWAALAMCALIAVGLALLLLNAQGSQASDPDGFHCASYSEQTYVDGFPQDSADRACQ